MAWRRIDATPFQPSQGEPFLIPLASLECEEEEKQAHLYFEGGCYVLYVGSNYKGVSEFSPVTHWFPEAIQVLKESPDPNYFKGESMRKW